MARGLLILHGAAHPVSPPTIAYGPASASAPASVFIEDGSSAPSNNKPNQRLTVLALAVASTLAIVFLLLIYYVVLLRHRSSLRRRRRRRLIRTLTSNDQSDGDDDVGNHHAWHIRTEGLDQEVIDAIPVLNFEEDGKRAVGDCDCAVCLSEFEHGELLRLLPKCGHTFHVQCVDTWLRSHVNCPLCRAPVLPPPVAPTHGDGGGYSVDSSEAGGAEAAVEATENLQEDTSQIRHGPASLVKVSKGGTESTSGSGESSAHDSPLGDASNPPLSDVEGSSDMEGSASEGSQLSNDGHQASPNVISYLMAVVPVQRSISMDSPLSVTSLPTLELCGSSDGKELALEKQLVVSNEERQENGPKGTSESKSPVEMARSLSSSGGNFLLSRFGRARSSSILPL